MADITVTAGSVLKGANAKTKHVTAGATITAGQPVYEDSSDSHKVKPAQADAAATAKCAGIALHGAADEQPVEIVYDDDDFTPGATVVVGTGYVVSAAAAGGIAPDTDLATTEYASYVMFPKSTSKCIVKIINTAAQHA